MKIKIAKDLLKIKAVFLRPDEPFTWASGIKSPIYCDNRLTLSDHDVRLDVESGIAQIIREETEMYFNGQKPVEETARMIQSRVGLYLAEQG